MVGGRTERKKRSKPKLGERGGVSIPDSASRKKNNVGLETGETGQWWTGVSLIGGGGEVVGGHFGLFTKGLSGRGTKRRRKRDRRTRRAALGFESVRRR